MTPDALFGPFVEYGFMRRALVGCVALSLGSAPVGVLLVLRRMSLVGDAMAHAILPGAAIGFLVAGLSLFAMTVGGVVTGLAVALLSGIVSRLTPLREDASFAAFYLVSLGLGVLLVSIRGSNVDLLHVLFGTVLALDDAALLLIGSITTITMIGLAIIYRPLLVECLDPGFLRVVSGAGLVIHSLFLALVVLNLVGGFHALGTLMVVGLMMLPATAARFWAETVPGQMAVAILLGLIASVAGLLLSYHQDLPASPAIILAAGVLYILSIGFGRFGSLAASAIRLGHVQR
ncbi:zinc/manganese transport system permease protein [Rhodoligotrophos appendicifer]|uniref:metal ABC transporter permease n=1 Tax=Rhodoligotrophos appendicifer TaxID=987056 RepID=UPI001185ECE5|nr:metal ABC transporter permease [Rhodoligotrophos appendicifer]